MAELSFMAKQTKAKRVVRYYYLDRQFGECEELWKELRDLVRGGEFTLGPPVCRFEERLAAFVGTRHAVGTNTGTDALILALKGLGIGSGDEVITQPNTFFATVGAIVATGARPVFVDVNEQYAIDERLIESAITPRTKAVLPVHYSGFPANMPAILSIAQQHRLVVVEDACAAFGARLDDRFVGSFGHAAAFSWHPQKMLNVWGDGGAVVTNDDDLNRWMRLYRNHGLKNRDESEFWGINTRLQSFQAVVANYFLDKVSEIIDRRHAIARRLDEGLLKIREIAVPPRPAGVRHGYTIYIVRAGRRDELLQFLVNKGVEAKIHYPIPLHLQKAARPLGYKRGDFPVCEAQAREIITFPAHEYITDDDVDYMVECVRKFYQGGP